MHRSSSPQPKIALAGLIRPVWSGDKEGQLARSLREMEALAREWGFLFHPCPEPVLTWEDGQRLRAELDAAGVDFLLLQTSSFGSGDALMPLVDGRYRLGVWSVPEPAVEGRLPLNSLCGANHLVSVIVQYAQVPHGVKWFHGQATDPFFQRRFRITVDALRGLKRLQGARIGLVGKHPMGFHNLFFDRRVVEKRFGVRFYDHELADVFARVRKIPPEKARQIAEEMVALASEVRVEPAALEQVGAFEAALLSAAQEGGYDALAVRCWPEWQDEFQRAPCSTLGRLNHLGIPTACEGDLLGALGMLLLNGIVGEPTTIMDMIAFDREDESILLWHCGPTAPALADEQGMRLTLHFNQRLPVANDMVFRKDPGTILQIMGDGQHIFLLDGEGMGREKPSYDGSRGWFRNLRMNRQPISVLDLISTVMAHGLKHHYALALRDCTEAVLEAAAWLGLETLQPVPYSDAKPLASEVR